MGDNYNESTSLFYPDLSIAPGNENIRVKEFKVLPIIGNELNVESGLKFKLIFYNFKPFIILDATFELSTVDDVCVFHTGKVLSPDKDARIGYYQVEFDISPYTLNAGRYKMKLIFGENQQYALWIDDYILNFEIENTLTGQGFNTRLLPGVLKPIFDWKCDFYEKY
ncbi:MAG: hypothetical protein QM800_14640 [Paludibacter sp.]